MDTFLSVLRRCAQLDSSSNRRRTPIDMRASRKAHFCGQIKACDYHRSVTWSTSSKGHRQRPNGKSMELQTLTFPVAVANDSACNFVEETSRSLNLSDGMFGIPLFSLSVCCRFTPWSQFVMFLLCCFVSGFVYVFDKRSAKRVLFCVPFSLRPPAYRRHRNS